MKWRPIKTAPKNQYVLLRYKPNPSEDKEFVHVGRWIDIPHINAVKTFNKQIISKERAESKKEAHWEIAYVAILLGIDYEDKVWEARSFRVNPSHWMPLPSLPSNRS